MKISVALATYNGEKYILEQLESIRKQSRTVDELIIRDDCSTDNTVELIKNYIAENELSATWSLIAGENNVGYASNFIGALRKTTGDLICFCDQDDIWLSDRIKEMEELMEAHSDMLLMGSEFEPFIQGEGALEVPSWELKELKNDKSLHKLEFNSHNIFIGAQGCTMCMRRELLDKISTYWYKGWAHDEFVWKLALCLDGLYMYRGYTLKRRIHADNASLKKMHKKDVRLKYLDDLLLSHWATLKFIMEVTNNPKQLKKMKRHIAATQLRIDLIRNKKLLNIVPLTIGYSDCFHKRRAIPVELLMAIRG